MITIQAENLTDIRHELEPLLEDHYKEVCFYPETHELNPDWEKYLELEELGCLFVHTARDDGELIGYIIAYLTYHPHYADRLYANNDVLYIKPEHRHTEMTYEFIKNFEKRCKKAGVNVITYRMKPYKPFQTLMDHLEYDKFEIGFSKEIKE